MTSALVSELLFDISSTPLLQQHLIGANLPLLKDRVYDGGFSTGFVESLYEWYPIYHKDAPHLFFFIRYEVPFMLWLLIRNSINGKHIAVGIVS